MLFRSRQPAWIVSELEALQLRLGDVSLQTPSLRAMRLKALRGVRLEWITLAAALCCAITMGPLAFLWWVDWAPGMVGGYTKSFQVACMAAAGVLSLAWGWMTLTVHRLAAQAISQPAANLRTRRWAGCFIPAPRGRWGSQPCCFR